MQSSLLSAQVDPHGAQLSSLRDRSGRQFLWHGDPGVWAGRAPILFPIVGTLANGSYRLGGRSHALGRHGFARNSGFEVSGATPSSADFRLPSSAATLAVYPFPFEFRVSYRIEGATLSVVASVRNTGSEDMPASLGFHPGFLWPLPAGAGRAAHYLEFETDEPRPIRRLGADGLLSPQAHPTPVSGRRLLLTDALFRDDVIILDDFRSRSVLYGADTGPKIEVGFPEARYLGIWTKPGAPFICIEPWQGITDPAGFAGDLFAKPGMFIVRPGERHAFGMTLSVHD